MSGGSSAGWSRRYLLGFWIAAPRSSARRSTRSCAGTVKRSIGCRRGPRRSRRSSGRALPFAGLGDGGRGFVRDRRRAWVDRRPRLPSADGHAGGQRDQVRDARLAVDASRPRPKGSPGCADRPRTRLELLERVAGPHRRGEPNVAPAGGATCRHVPGRVPGAGPGGEKLDPTTIGAADLRPALPGAVVRPRRRAAAGAGAGDAATTSVGEVSPPWGRLSPIAHSGERS